MAAVLGVRGGLGVRTPGRGARSTRRGARGSGVVVAAAAAAAPTAVPQEPGAVLVGDALPAYEASGEWRKNLDLKAWAAEVRAAAKEVPATQEDSAHLDKILTWANVCYFTGVALSAVCVNPIGPLLVSTAINARWTMVGHHVCHGGYNKLNSEGAEVTGRFHRRTFGKGAGRRMTDWLDWMLPEAWDVEHNHMHHFQLGEEADPDLVERNLDEMRRGDMGPMPVRYAIVALLAGVWKWYYYGPNTLKEMLFRDARRAEARGEEVKTQPFTTGDDGRMPMTLMLASAQALKGDLHPMVQIAKSFMPYFLMQFCVVPLAFAPFFGLGVSKIVLINMLIAEVMTNIHSFVIIATNHIGDDIYRFDTTCKPKSDEFLLRAVIGSANFHTGSYQKNQTMADIVDFSQGWLNYQVEHHMFEDMTMLQYQRVQPKVKEICEKHGVPYVQESVFKRVGQLVDVMVGKKSMRRWELGH